jgi:pyridinium-3,5-biscarboxylic acid mononucleotide sulfurtransferase
MAFSGRGIRTPNCLCKAATRCHFLVVNRDKIAELRLILRSYGSCLIAYSGGVDSALLAFLTDQELGDKALAVIADTPSLPRRELAEARQIAGQFGFRLRAIGTAEFSDEEYLANPANRCFFCKHALFDDLKRIAEAEQFAVIAYGENASDVGDYRPGAQAAAKFEVRAPLKEAGFTKAEIRELSAELGLPTADKPEMPCLSSRIPYGEAVTTGKLEMIEAAEIILRDRGFVTVRVRHHEVGGIDQGPRARIEMPPEDITRFMAQSDEVFVAIRELGYREVTVDQQGYRRGSLNEAILASPTAG